MIRFFFAFHAPIILHLILNFKLFYCRVNKVSISTIRAWEKQWNEKGTLVPAPVVRGYKKIEPQRLKTYVQEHPDAYPKEIAVEFNCCETAVRKAFKRLGITRKKRRYITGKRTHKK